MIIRLIGNVKYPLTLDPTVWIFDDRKIPFDDAFKVGNANAEKKSLEEDWEKTSRAWDREVYQQRIKPPVNKSISRLEGKKILEGTFVMPIKDFLKTSEPKENAQSAWLYTDNGECTVVDLTVLSETLLLFAKDGKPLKEEGPVHFFYGDGSNKDEPIKGIIKIEVK